MEIKPIRTEEDYQQALNRLEIVHRNDYNYIKKTSVFLKQFV